MKRSLLVCLLILNFLSLTFASQGGTDDRAHDSIEYDLPSQNRIRVVLSEVVDGNSKAIKTMLEINLVSVNGDIVLHSQIFDGSPDQAKTHLSLPLPKSNSVPGHSTDHSTVNSLINSSIDFGHPEFESYLKEQGLFVYEKSPDKVLFVVDLNKRSDSPMNPYQPVTYMIPVHENISKEYTTRRYNLRLINSKDQISDSLVQWEANSGFVSERLKPPFLLFQAFDYKPGTHHYENTPLFLINMNNGASFRKPIARHAIQIGNPKDYQLKFSVDKDLRQLNISTIDNQNHHFERKNEVIIDLDNNDAGSQDAALQSQSPKDFANNRSYDLSVKFPKLYDPGSNLLKLSPSSSRPPRDISKFFHREELSIPKGRIEIATYLRQIEEGINSVLEGQPEAVQVLLGFEKLNIGSGYENKKPNVAWFAGLPGTGKDTLVEVYLQVKHALRYPNLTENFDFNDHLFRLPKLIKESDLNEVRGAPPGYVDSGNLSAFIEWLVLHSGGKYYIKRDEKTKAFQGVHLNTAWYPGDVLPGYFAPEDGVLFANEFHDWNKSLINLFLKEGAEKGSFEIGNAAGGLSRIEVPVNIVIASNHLINRIAARDSKGKRVGPPLSEEELMQNWRNAQARKDSVFEDLKIPTLGNENGGVSEEFLSRVGKRGLVILRPLVKKALLSIAKYKLSQVQKNYARKKKNDYPSVNFVFDQSVLEFLVTYDQNAEDGARPLDSKIRDLIQNTLNEFILKSSSLDSGSSKKSVKVSIQQNKDHTWSLIVDGKNIFIPLTKKDKLAKPISDKKIDELLGLEEKLKARVKGVDAIIEALARDVRNSANSGASYDPKRNTRLADVYMFLGSSSTGKTELGVALHQILYKENSRPLVLDFSQIHHVDQLKELIFGRKLPNGDFVESEFMKEYRRRNGDLVVIFDEISNANPEVQKGLFELLREPNVVEFSDNEPRSMGRVKIVMTGNHGEEWYKDVPRDIPEHEQYEAARRIYENSTKNESLLRSFLNKRFYDGFVNRVTMDRIYFFGPHKSSTIRSLVQTILVKAFKQFSKKKEGVRTWNVQFETHEDYVKTIESIEKYGFRIWEQGASITHFINTQLMTRIHDELFKNKVPMDSTIKIRKLENEESYGQSEFNDDPSFSKVNFEIVIDSENSKRITIPMALKGKVFPLEEENPKIMQLRTAFHEAGHSILGQLLNSDTLIASYIGISPGVTLMGDRWLRYAGIAESFDVKSQSNTRESFIANLAKLVGGGVAESLAIKNKIFTSGHRNDLERATQLARRMVIEFNMGKKYGMTVPQGQTAESYLQTLSEKQKRYIEEETTKILKEARQLAEDVLKAHFESHLMPLAKLLAQKGEMRRIELDEFYTSRKELALDPYSKKEMKSRMKRYEDLTARSSKIKTYQGKRDFEFHDFIESDKVPVLDMKIYLENKFQQEVSGVDLNPGKAITATSRKDLLRQKLSNSGVLRKNYQCLKNYKTLER